MTYSSDVVAGADVYQSDHNKIRQDLFLGARIKESVAGAAIVTLDLSDVTKGAIKYVTMNQNTTLRFSGVLQYPTFCFVRFDQDSTGGRVLTIDVSGIHYEYGVAPVLETTANSRTSLLFVFNSATDVDCYSAGYSLRLPA